MHYSALLAALSAGLAGARTCVQTKVVQEAVQVIVPTVRLLLSVAGEMGSYQNAGRLCRSIHRCCQLTASSRRCKMQGA